MKKALIIVVILLVIFGIIGAILFSTGVGMYNKIVAGEEKVQQKWSQVQNVYQRRSDLIPNLAATVEGYAQHEKGTLVEVAEARSQMGGVVKLDENMLRDPAAMERFQAAQSTFAGGLQRLMMVTERYPDLKANEQFKDLMIQLEGSENRISVERGRYNEEVLAFNTMVRQFPMVIVARIIDVKPFVHFKASEKAQSVPTIKFGTNTSPSNGLSEAP